MGTHSVSLNELFGNIVKSLWSIAIFMTAECETVFFFVQKSVDGFDSFRTGSSRIQSFRTNDLFKLSPALPRKLEAVKTITS